MMLNQFGCYQNANPTAPTNANAGLMYSTSNSNSTAASYASADVAAAAAVAACAAVKAAATSTSTSVSASMSVDNSITKAERESIHSGQFMVSHFEAEEAQEDDLDDDGEIKMLDPEDPSLAKPGEEENPCLDVQLYVPQKSLVQRCGGTGSLGICDQLDGEDDSPSLVTSHLEIETSLTKLFKCMNLAYSQKLTSPKWNHFKGVRLRWKDKIRLNNVIWRCWHMQFIQKRRTPVCQFASPLDVDIHSNPQTVVLEGKYWKRQLAVIKAEYRKWRKNYKSKATGCLTYDSKSEFDFLEWSPLNDRTLMLTEDWGTDTLFSSINGPFPFPDPREIARGASIADFIQPSLGSLQPNLEYSDISIADLLPNTRLPPVPEEGTDEMLKSVDYSGFSAIMGADQMDASNSMMDDAPPPPNSNTNVVSNGVGGVNDDANMLELNTPINNMPYADIEEQFAAARNTLANSQQQQQQQLANNSLLNDVQLQQQQRTALGATVGGSVLSMGDSSPNAGYSRSQSKHFGGISESSSSMTNRQQNEYPSKSVINGRISKNSQRPFRREPHNYDKAQPTLHQTTIYQQMLAEQQQQKNQQQHQQHLQQPTLSSSMLQHQASAYQSQQQQQQNQQRLHFPTQQQTPQQQQQQYAFGGTLGYDHTGSGGGLTASTSMINLHTTSTSQQNSPQHMQMLNVKVEPHASDLLSMFQMNSSSSNDGYGNSINSYKPYPNPNLAHFKKSASTGTFINVPRLALNSNSQQQQQQTQASYLQQQHQQQEQQQQISAMQSLGLGSLTSQQLLQLTRQTIAQHQQQQQQQQQQPTPNSPQHQMQQLQQQQQQQSQPTIILPTQQQATLSAVQQQQQQQQLQLPKEIHRSNSLPLNVSLHKLQDQFAIPKYHAKSSKARVRSNSIHQHSVVAAANNGASVIGGASVSGASASATSTAVSNMSVSNLLSTQQQFNQAISDPMLQSTLAQLLTANTRQHAAAASAKINKQQHQPQQQQCASPSAINPAAAVAAATTLHVPQPTTGIFASQQLQLQQTNVVVGSQMLGSSPKTQQDFLHQRHQQQQSQHATHTSPKKSASLPTPIVTPTSLHSPPANKMLSFPLAAGQHPTSSSLSLSPDSFHDQDSPLSPTQSLKAYPRDTQRRAGHIHAEQKRRYNIKNGFDMLHELIPQLQQNPNAKLSKAAMLQKGAEHIKHLRAERNVLKDKMEALRMERETLNNSLMHLHSMLPANGAPVTRQGTEHVRQLFEQYVRYRTMSNWKFWILGLILEPLLASYTSSVSSASLEELRRTAFLWIDQHCSLIDLRPAVSNKLKYLSMNTDILSDPPSTLKDEVAKALHNANGQHPNLHGT